jgi:hypothetical protein
MTVRNEAYLFLRFLLLGSRSIVWNPSSHQINEIVQIYDPLFNTEQPNEVNKLLQLQI